MTDLLQTTPTAFDLLVVDEPQARAPLVQALSQKGYRVHEADCGEKALALLETRACDLMLLEATLPGMAGGEVLRRARQKQGDMLLLVLAAHATVDSAVAAIKANAVDYIVKPCKVEDVMAVISRAFEERARQMHYQRLLGMIGEAMDVLRPQSSAPPAPAPVAVSAFAAALEQSAVPVEAGALSLDRQKRLATLKSEPARTVELTESEVSILVLLMEKPNEVFSYKQLAKTVGYDGMDKWTVENVIRSVVFRLRQKIEPTEDSPRLIRTVRGRGYYFSPAPLGARTNYSAM